MEETEEVEGTVVQDGRGDGQIRAGGEVALGGATGGMFERDRRNRGIERGLPPWIFFSFLTLPRWS